jgi:hypothetical protein
MTATTRSPVIPHAPQYGTTGDRPHPRTTGPLVITATLRSTGSVMTAAAHRSTGSLLTTAPRTMGSLLTAPTQPVRDSR